MTGQSSKSQQQQRVQDTAAASSSSSSSSSTSERWPKVVVFDLDNTLWPLDIDMDVTPPLRRHKDTSTPPLNTVTDRRGYRFGLYPDAPDILRELSSRGVHIAAASRTTAPDLAREALANIYLEGEDGEVVKAASYFGTMEIYPGSKMRHFKQIHARTKVDYEEMLFFDDERRNKEVEQLGVTMQFITSGLDRQVFQRGLDEWRRRRASD